MSLRATIRQLSDVLLSNAGLPLGGLRPSSYEENRASSRGRPGPLRPAPTLPVESLRARLRPPPALAGAFHMLRPGDPRGLMDAAPAAILVQQMGELPVFMTSSGTGLRLEALS